MTIASNSAVRERPAYAPLTLSTDDLPAQGRFDAWQEIFGVGIARIEVGTDNRPAFRAQIHAQPLPNLMLTRLAIPACSLTRTPGLLRDGDDSLVFILCLTGQGELRFGQERVTLTPGTGTLASTHLRGGSYCATGVTSYSLRIARPTLRSFAPAFEDALLRPLRPGDPALAILRAYLQTLLVERQALTAPMAALADGQIRELLAHILNPGGDLARAAPYGGIKAARLRAILDDIAAHIGEPGLSAASTGARLGLSARYVQRLFDGAGQSFSEHARDLRLDRARQLLADPQCAHLRVTDICAMAGFNDLSHFNRRYRARFGDTPTRARRR